MITALFGSSCAGKTSMALRLQTQNRLPLRQCGEEVRKLASLYKLNPHELPIEAHQKIDAKSIEWVQSNAELGGIIEGRFLDAVLPSVRRLVNLIHVTAAHDVRAERWEKRKPGVNGYDEVLRQDEADEAFRHWMYSAVSPMTASKLIETDREIREWNHLL